MLSSVHTRLGEAHREFDCCDTEFVVDGSGAQAVSGVDAAQDVAERLESVFNAFDDESAVSRLNRYETVRNEHVARVVRRGMAYHERTDGAFDIRQDRIEHDLKAFIRGDRQSPPDAFEIGTIRIDGNRGQTDPLLDLNGLAKGHIVDRAAALDGVGRDGLVGGGGDLSPLDGPVSAESPYGDETPLKTLDTD